MSRGPAGSHRGRVVGGPAERSPVFFPRFLYFFFLSLSLFVDFIYLFISVPLRWSWAAAAPRPGTAGLSLALRSGSAAASPLTAAQERPPPGAVREPQSEGQPPPTRSPRKVGEGRAACAAPRPSTGGVRWGWRRGDARRSAAAPGDEVGSKMGGGEEKGQGTFGGGGGSGLPAPGEPERPSTRQVPRVPAAAAQGESPPYL